MEPKPEELLSALRDAEEFISVTLPKESLTRETENKRQQLETKLKNLTNRTNTTKANKDLPPRLPKPAPNIPQEENDGEDLYDDVGIDAIEVKEEGANDRPMSPSYYTMGIDGVTKETQDNTPLESYEDMSLKDASQREEETYDDTVNAISEENYEEPMKEDSMITEDINYEIAEPNKPQTNDTIEEDDGLYDGVDTMDKQEEDDDKAKSVNFEPGERSMTVELGKLTNPVKTTDVKDVLYKGYLDKHRKRGIYIGSKWQRRYCIVRSFALYYFVNQNSERQKGTIILPGYKVSYHKPSKTSREFTLTRDQDRTYTFQVESKEEVDKWINAIQKAANTRISNRQSEILDTLRSQVVDGDDDTSSLSYDDVGSEKAKNGIVAQDEVAQEIYDDVNENEQSETGTIDYEIPQATPDKTKNAPAAMEETPGLGRETSPATAQDLEIYEMPGDEDEETSAPIQPPRPAAIGQSAPSMPGRPGISPVSIEEEELYDDVGVDVPTEPAVAQPPAKPQIPERNLPLPPPPSEGGKASPAMQRPALPSPPREPKQGIGKPSIPPRKNGPLPPEPGKELTPNGTSSIGKAPPPPPPEEEPKPDKAPPPPPPEEDPNDQVIDYASIYQALWDCKPDADDELEFNRGDLIYVYEKPHSDWWIGSKYKPQGHDTRLIPKNYLTEAYNA